MCSDALPRAAAPPAGLRARAAASPCAKPRGAWHRGGGGLVVPVEGPGPRLERAVLELLARFAADRDLCGRVVAEEVAKAQPQAHELARRREAVQDSLRELERRLGRYCRAFEDGTLAPEVVRERLADLARAREQLEEEARAMAREEAFRERRALRAGQIEERLASLANAMDALEPEELWQVLHTLIREVWVDGQGAVRKVLWAKD